MTAVKLQKFLGTAPKTSPELLPDNGAQIAKNAKIYSGDLIPYPQPVIVDNLGKTGEIRTLYGIRNPDPNVDEIVFIGWDSIVDIATPAADDFEDRKFYYTGDGAPKVSTFDLATSGGKPYPTTAYDLGLPLPTIKPTATPSDFTPVSTSTVTRDASGNVTLALRETHNLKDGALARVSGFTKLDGTYGRSGTTITVTINDHGISVGDSVFLRFTSGGATTNQYTVTEATTNTFKCTDSVSSFIGSSNTVELDMSSFNITTEATIIDPATISYFSPGFSLAERAITDGKVDLGGQIQARSYIYTWFTPWLEESINSEPSDAIFIKEGQIVTITNLPTAPPAGDNFVRGIRLYRTLAGTTDADFFRLSTLWYPNNVTSSVRTGGVSTITFEYPHSRIVGDRFRLSGMTEGSYNGEHEIASVVDSHTITFDQTGVSDSPALTDSGTFYYDVAESLEDTPRYWGFGGDYSFTDDFSFRSVTGVLPSENYEAPPADLQGLVLLQNNILAGFVGNDVYFSEPGQYHAWPAAYKRSFDSNIVAILPNSGNIIILTEDYPYLISGNDPAVFTQTRLTGRYPCVSRQSVSFTSVGAVYASHDGLILVSATTPQLLTRIFHSSESWNESVDPTTLVGTTFKDKYFASYDTGSLVLEEFVDRQRASIIDCDASFTAAWYDSIDNDLYYVADETGSVYRWDDDTQPAQTMQWRSKTFITKDYVNLGAARVIADYNGSVGSSVWGALDENWDASEEKWNTNDPITFKLFLNGEANDVASTSPYFTTTCSNDSIFRLPAGFKTDTMCVEIESSVRVRAIHLGPTPTSLKGL